ncbi:hypothetical protein [Paraburkholderia sp. BCC1884]|uniref:hypothetical protein n=1 Tax=Paraburkholderia sp. BCC1884 TaxID=2562668 RepID=UPI00118299AE|nr:hypothetical protein [Paraburkholderia sp. BCC1884]
MGTSAMQKNDGDLSNDEELDSDTEHNLNDELDYEPPVSRNYMVEIMEDAEGWALKVAKDLICIHEGGPAFYENLDSRIIAQWLFDDFPEVVSQLGKQGTMESFRAKLTHFCTRMTAASAYAQTLNRGYPVDTRADLKETFSELQFPRQIDVDKEWMAPLPIEVAVLYDRLRRHALRSRYETAPHERFSLDGWSEFDLPQVRAAGNNAGYVLDSKHWPFGVFNLTSESVSLVVAAPQGATDYNLVWQDECVCLLSEAQDGTIETAESFAGGRLVLPLVRHEQFFRRLRSRLPVLYVFEDHVLLVEYKWNLVEAARLRFEEARNEDAKLAVGEGLSVKRRLSPASHHRIEQLSPLPRATANKAQDENGSWDEYGMPKAPF